MLDLELLVYTIPSKPRSSKQEYKITIKGIRYFHKLRGTNGQTR